MPLSGLNDGGTAIVNLPAQSLAACSASFLNWRAARRQIKQEQMAITFRETKRRYMNTRPFESRAFGSWESFVEHSQPSATTLTVQKNVYHATNEVKICLILSWAKRSCCLRRSRS